MRVLVCGGRAWAEVNTGRGQVTREEMTRLKAIASAQRQQLYDVLDAYHEAHQIDLIIHGAAPGADRCAMAWAFARRVKEKGFRAEWTKYRKGAGPMRNRRMLLEGKPDVVIAFPGDVGTADMVSKAKAAGVPILEQVDDATP